MSDAYRRYRAILQSLLQLYRPRPRGHQQRHLYTLVRLICGIIGSGQCQLPKVVTSSPGGRASDPSVVRQYERWLRHDKMTEERWVLPVARELLRGLAAQPLRIVFDGSTVGRGCMALMASVLYGNRALPLAWVVRQAPKGHFPQEAHRALLAVVCSLLPEGSSFVVLGDGEFDGTGFLADIRAARGQYVCRTASTLVFQDLGFRYRLDEFPIAEGTALLLPEVTITLAEYGPLHVFAVWQEGCAAPLYLLSTFADLDTTLWHYRHRAHIETFFSDQKSRGFHIQRSHLSDPVRLTRLLIAAALGYIWLVYLGTFALSDPWRARLHRRHRCDLSLFQLGLRLLAYCLRHHQPIPAGFLPLPSLPQSHIFSVR